MRTALTPALLGLFLVMVVMFSCTTSSVLNNTSTSGGTSGEDSGFSDAPISPGGTGGDGSGIITGADDVQLPAEETRSFFTAFQIDPVEEDTAGPKFVVAGDIDQDGLMDLVSAWNQSQPVQLHLQRRDAAGNISFRTVTLAGTAPIAIVAGLQVGQINDDGWLDVVVLSKATGAITLCPVDPPSEISRLEGEIVILFNPGSATAVPDGNQWTQMILVNPYIAERWIHNQFPGIEFKSFEESKTFPEWNGFTDLVVANIDGQPGDDILVALNPGECGELDQSPPSNTVDLWLNPGPGQAETSAAWGIGSGDGFGRGVPIALAVNFPQIKDIEVMDVDGDSDLDVIVTWTNLISPNIQWLRNPLVPHETGGPGGLAELTRGFSSPGFSLCSGGDRAGLTCVTTADCPGLGGICPAPTWRFIAGGWEQRPIGQVDTAADIITLGDVDNDGFDDVVVRSTIGQIIQWFRHPTVEPVSPEFPPPDPTPSRFNFPWQVFTLTEFADQAPQAIAIGDLTNDGFNEIIVAVEGGVFWYDGTVGTSVFDPWFPNAIIQDEPQDTTTDPTLGEGVAPGSGVGVSQVDTSTVINAILIVDLDNDGRNDIIGTLDRRTGSGLSDDRLVWYRNTRTDP